MSQHDPISTNESKPLNTTLEPTAPEATHEPTSNPETQASTFDASADHDGSLSIATPQANQNIPTKTSPPRSKVSTASRQPKKTPRKQ